MINPEYYSNPLILQRADPWIYRHMDGKYYFTASVPEYDRIELRVADTIEELASALPQIVWRRHAEGEMSQLIWAPEIHYVRGKWYIYFAAAHTDTLHIQHQTFQHRMYVLEAERPEGPWQERGQIKTELDSFCLDATVFEYDQRLYYVWAQKDPDIKGNSNLYIAEMENPWTLKRPSVMLTHPEYDWECSVIPVNEGPAVLIREPWIYLTYSANATGPEYCMGMLKARTGSDLLSASSWEKSPSPVFESCDVNKRYGPGHSCFTKSEDGQQDLLVYHVRQVSHIDGDPLYEPNRHTCVQPVIWRGNGMLDLGVPAEGIRKNGSYAGSYRSEKRGAHRDEEKQPNIVILVNDHQAFYGHPGVHRPNFMKLAREGVLFERAYCSSPLCCPSRKTMLTGKMPSRHGQLENAIKTDVDSDATYYDYLREAGYDLYYFGKWHAGDGTPSDLGCQGVSYPDYSNPYRQPEYEQYIRRKGLSPAEMMVEYNLWPEDLLKDAVPGAVYNFPREMTNEALSGLLVTEKESHEAFYLADLACRQLEELAQSKKDGTERPFCLRVDFWGPHQPYHPTREYADMYPPESIPEYPSFRDTLEHKPESYLFDTSAGISENHRLNVPNSMPWSQWQEILSRCYGQISLIDEAGGLILDQLKALGLDENTLVLWTADHGDALGCHGGHFDKACYMPEEVMRIPLAVRYPSVIPAGSVSEALISNADIAPSLLAAAGLRFSEKIDGRSFLDLFRKQSTPWRTIITAETNGHLAPWFGRMAADGRYKFIYNKGDINELYDLANDPWEMNNLVNDEACAEIVNKFKTALKLEI